MYRDIDSDFNRKVDQYRWLGTAGMRWAIDTNEDGRIDRWKAISPEEVSEELIAALGTRDADRFRRLLLTEEELQGLRLGRNNRPRNSARKSPIRWAVLEEFLRTQEFVKPDGAVGEFWQHATGRRAGRYGPARSRICRSTRTPSPWWNPVADMIRSWSAR